MSSLPPPGNLSGLTNLAYGPLRIFPPFSPPRIFVLLYSLCLHTVSLVFLHPRCLFNPPLVLCHFFSSTSPQFPGFSVSMDRGTAKPLNKSPQYFFVLRCIVFLFHSRVLFPFPDVVNESAVGTPPAARLARTFL